MERRGAIVIVNKYDGFTRSFIFSLLSAERTTVVCIQTSFLITLKLK